MEDSTQYLIIGGSAAGLAAAHEIRFHDKEGTITVLSEEPDAPYFRPMIPFLVSGKKQAGDIFMTGSGPYTQKGISVETGSRVVKVNTQDKAVSLEDGRQVTYEKVLLATGSTPYIPENLTNADAAGVFAFRTLSQARLMAEQVETTRHAVMLGGGLLNLKTAFALLEKGVKVTLVVYSPEVLSQLMDPEDAVLIRKALDQAGLDILTGCAATDIITENGRVTGVALDNGKELACRMVCIGKGVRPNTDFLLESGIAIDNGIVADTYTCCNIPDTYTAGDVSVTHDPATGDRVVTALWTNAVEMGRCAGKNMAGVKTAYTGTFGILNATQVADEPFVSMGQAHTKGLDLDVYHHITDTSCRKIVFNRAGDRLIGAVFVGDITRAGLYRYVIREKMPVQKIKTQIIDQTLHYGHLLTY